MRVFLLILLAIAAALLETSVLPWIPLLARFGVIGIVTVMLIIKRPQTRAYLWFAMAATIIADALVGAPVGARTILVLATIIALQPAIRSLRLDPRIPTVVVISVVMALADRAGTMLPLRFSPTTIPWATTVIAWWWAAVANVAVGYAAFRIARQAAKN